MFKTLALLNSPELFWLMFGFIFLPHLVHCEVIVQPVATACPYVHQLQGKTASKVALPCCQPSNNQSDYVLMNNKD